jgi:hypothetical protein
MMRVENMTSVDAILEEIEVYGDMLPRDGTLSATLFIQLTSDADLRKWLPVFTKLEGNLALKIGGESVQAEFEPGRTREDKTSSVHYIKFRLSEKQRAAMKKEPAEFVCTLEPTGRCVLAFRIARRAMLHEYLHAGGDAGDRHQYSQHHAKLHWLHETRAGVAR